MYKSLLRIVVVITLFFLFTTPTLAHVVIKPNQAGIASFQTFIMGVPNERNVPTIGMRLVIPEGVKHVSPNVKPGWTITERKNGNGENAMVTEINWTGGMIPAGQRDDFYFSAQVPSDETTLAWKAYQTYVDGIVIAWDKNPVTLKKSGEGEPYSTTKVINDLTANTPSSSVSSVNMFSKFDHWLSLLAVILSTGALLISVNKSTSKRKK